MHDLGPHGRCGLSYAVLSISLIVNWRLENCLLSVIVGSEVTQPSWLPSIQSTARKSSLRKYVAFICSMDASRTVHGEDGFWWKWEMSAHTNSTTTFLLWKYISGMPYPTSYSSISAREYLFVGFIAFQVRIVFQMWQRYWQLVDHHAADNRIQRHVQLRLEPTVQQYQERSAPL